jgi:hypothetical protein
MIAGEFGVVKKSGKIAFDGKGSAKYRQSLAQNPSLRRSSLLPVTLALMHGSAFRGDTVAAIGALADHYEARLQKAMGR